MKTIIQYCTLAFCIFCILPSYSQTSLAKSEARPLNSYVMVPKAFSPNFDGINDAFKVAGKDIAKFEIHIYNRQGQLVYHSEDIDAEWDGKYKGLSAQSGLYVWIIKYEGHTNEMKSVKNTLKGNLTLLL